MTPQAIIDEIKASGLRGRGGAGFPTGRKWAVCARDARTTKYIICNGDEGDPGAFMDRSVLEADPHAVLEGMIIGAKAIGAQGLHLRPAEYPLAIQRVKIAIDRPGSTGCWARTSSAPASTSTSRSPGRRRLRLRRRDGADRLHRGPVADAPPAAPLPGPQGPVGQAHGHQQRRDLGQRPADHPPGRLVLELGTETSTGTKVFALAGKVNNTGLVEVPMGITLREIVYDIGGGIPDGRKLKAVQIGGPSGGCIPGQAPRPARRLRVAHRGRGHHGLGRHDRHGRRDLHGRRRQVLPGVPPTSPAASAPPAARARSRMLEILERICEGKGR